MELNFTVNEPQKNQSKINLFRHSQSLTIEFSSFRLLFFVLYLALDWHFLNVHNQTWFWLCCSRMVGAVQTVALIR